MSSAHTAIIDAALALAERGYAVSPVTKSKIPFKGTNGFNDATTDPDTIIALFAGKRFPQVSINTERSGLFVLDMDIKRLGYNGRESLRLLQNEYTRLPDTPEALTPSGGRHYYFRGQGPSPENFRPGLDIRSRGACVLCPPSQGERGQYRWVTSLLEEEPTDAPEWLVEVATASVAATTDRTEQGRRNDTLFRVSSLLRRLGYPDPEREHLLTGLNAAFTVPLDAAEVRKITASASRYHAGTGDELKTNDSDLAEEVAMRLTDTYRWNATIGAWMEYQSDRGIWESRAPEDITGAVDRTLRELLGGGQSLAKIRAVEALMRSHLKGAFDQQHLGLLPMGNGVLHLDTGQLRAYQREDYFSWQVPYAYDPEAECPKTQHWLLEAMEGDGELVETLRAYLRAIVLGRAELQVFLEVYGPGGTGKSTYARIAQALIGPQNSHATRLRELEHNTYDPANLYGKRLALINEAASYAGSVDTLKALTGGDTVRFEKKYKDAGGFRFGGMVLLCGNQALKTGEHSSGLARRRLSIYFGVVPDRPRELMEFYADQPRGELADELPGILNWVLRLPDERMRELLSPYGRGSKSLRASAVEVLRDTNPFMDWAMARLIPESTARSLLKTLHADYSRWAEEQNHKSCSQQTFGRSIADLLPQALGVPVTKTRSHGARYLEGVRLRVGSEREAFED